jgi:Reverse transcriptase (RNA-dependent DNA polymerase)/RNase H-like domain found in reverse transcriptase
VEGFLGSDFFQIFQVEINYEHQKLRFRNDLQEIEIPMSTNDANCFVVNERCETYQRIRTSATHECVIETQEIAEGVFIASIIASPCKGAVTVKNLNTRFEKVQIKNFKPTMKPLVDYEIFNFNREQIDSERVEKLLKILDYDGLNTEEQRAVQEIVAKYADVFYLENDPATHTEIYQQQIPLKPDATPVYVRPYRIPHSQKGEVDRQVQQMLIDKIIEPAKSEWSSPILLVPKKADSAGNKKWRLVLDYRRLNDQIQDDKFPLANITDIFDSLAGAVYFSTLDLSQGYYQMEIKESDRPCTAFVTDKGQYQMRKLPMGLKISPSSFSRMMTVAMSGLNYDKCFVYLDDLICFGKNIEQHNKNLISVLQRLRQVNLKLNPKKSILLRKSVVYLGHKIAENGISPDPDKFKIMKDFPIPKNANETKRFVAFANYYRRFIEGFSIIAQPLNKLSRKDVAFVWDEHCQKAFDTLKNELIGPNVLDFPDLSESNEFCLTTDASKMGLGAVLSNSNGRPVAYASRALNA